MYLVYIRPLFEYACEVWDNWGIGYSDKLEKLQLDAARIVDWLLRRIAFLNLDNESNFLIAMSSLFHSLTVEGIHDELVIESLQKGTIKLSPFRNGS
jgi:hypothetical protein